MLGLILTENSFEFDGNNYLQTHGVAMGTKTALSFANIYMAEIEQTSSKKSKPSQEYVTLHWWRFLPKDVELFIESKKLTNSIPQ